MPTTDERREVAARLREHVKTARHVGYACVLKNCTSEKECDSLGLEGCEECFNKSLKSLADLIEPEQTHICLGCIKWSAIEGNPVKGVCAEFSDPEDGIERATPYYGYCHEWEGA